MAIKLNHLKPDIGVIMQKSYSKELLINCFSFFTESGGILGVIKKTRPLKGAYVKVGTQLNYYGKRSIRKWPFC